MKVLRELPPAAFALLTTLFNSILRVFGYPLLWKFEQIIMVPKPGKPTHEVASYRTISLLPTPLKSEKLLLKQLQTDVDLFNLIPGYKFGFRHGHSPVQQGHRIVNEIMKRLEVRTLSRRHSMILPGCSTKCGTLAYCINWGSPSRVHTTCFWRHITLTATSMSDIKTRAPTVTKWSLASPKGSVLGPLLYLLLTADLPTMEHTTIATFADDTGLLAVHSDPDDDSQRLQNHLTLFHDWFEKWKISVNPPKSAHVTFTARHVTSPTVFWRTTPFSVTSEFKYLGLNLDRQLTWRKHIQTQCQQVYHKLHAMSWLLGRRSKLSLSNKILLYKCVLKSVWKYGIQLWGCAKPSNTQILQRFQFKILLNIANAPWYVSNLQLHTDMGISFVRTGIRRSSLVYHRGLTGT